MRLQNKEQHFVSVFILSPPPPLLSPSLYLAPPLRGQKLNKPPGGLIELLRCGKSMSNLNACSVKCPETLKIQYCSLSYRYWYHRWSRNTNFFGVQRTKRSSKFVSIAELQGTIDFSRTILSQGNSIPGQFYPTPPQRKRASFAPGSICFYPIFILSKSIFEMRQSWLFWGFSILRCSRFWNMLMRSVWRHLLTETK